MEKAGKKSVCKGKIGDYHDKFFEKIIDTTCTKWYNGQRVEFDSNKFFKIRKGESL
jgi:hypothetical protein